MVLSYIFFINWVCQDGVISQPLTLGACARGEIMVIVLWVCVLQVYTLLIAFIQLDEHTNTKFSAFLKLLLSNTFLSLSTAFDRTIHHKLSMSSSV